MEDLMKLSKETLIGRMAEMQARLDAREDEDEKRRAAPPARPARRVRVKLGKDGPGRRDDLFVSVNGERFLLRRGAEVEVPDYIADAIAESALSDAAAQARQERLAGEYEG